MTNFKLISAMKWTKDRMDSPVAISDINNLIDLYKQIGATKVDISTVIGHPNFVSYTKTWLDACHAKGLFATLRCAHQNMEGLYNAPKFVGTNRKPSQFWIDEGVNAIKSLGASIQLGDQEAFYPERTEGIFSDDTAFLANASPQVYADFFTAMHEAIKATGSVIQVGLSSNNASELLSGWMSKSLSDKYGYVCIDHYVDGNPAQFEADVRTIYARYGKPIYVQEGAVNRFAVPTKAQADSYYAVVGQLITEGIIQGYGAWGGWPGNPESLITGTGGLTAAGSSLQTIWGGTTPTPTPDPTQPSTLVTFKATLAIEVSIFETPIFNQVIDLSNLTDPVKIAALKTLLSE